MTGFETHAPLSAEMMLLAAAVMLGLVQLGLAALYARRQYGMAWAVGARDETVPSLAGVAARLDRAFRNFMDTFPLFAAAALAAEVLGRHNDWTLLGGATYVAARIVYVPLYGFGVILARSLVWIVATLGIAMVLVGLFQAA